MTFIIVLHVVICVFLIAVILIQPGKGDAGIGFGSSSQSIFGSAGASNFLTKTTTVCAVIFITTSFFLTRSRMQEYNSSVISVDEAKQSETSEVKSEPNAEPKATEAPSNAETK